MAVPGSVTTKEIVDQAAETTAVWESAASSFLRTLQNNAASLISPSLPNVPNDLPGTPFESVLFSRLGAEPQLGANALFVPPNTEPGTPSIGNVSPAALVNIPDYTIGTPAIDLPTRPQLDTPVAPTAPVLVEATLPVSPTLDLPTAPTLSSVVFPDAPTLALPVFSEAAPEVLPALALSDVFEYQDAVFDDELLAAVRKKLTADVNNGGYGIETLDENALWFRARDREMTELRAVELATKEQYTSRGYDVPPGALLGALAEARDQSERRLNETNREISIKRADLFRDNRRFTMQQGLAVEQARLTNYGFSMERALNAQRFAAEFTINVHDAKVRDFNARLQRYISIAEVFRSQLQAALTQVQIYEAEVRAAVSKQQANQIDVELYRALLSASETRVNLFEAQTRAAALTIEIQRARVEAFRAEVQAFSSQVDGNRAQLDVYTAGIQGEEAKINIFSKEVDAYGARVSAAAIEQNAANSRVQTQLENSRIVLAEYEAKVRRYQANIAAESTRIEALLRTYGTEATVFSAAVQGYEALARVDISEESARIQAIQEQTKRLQTNATIALQAATNTLTERFQAANAGAQITTGVIQAANSTLQGLIVEELTQSSTA